MSDENLKRVREIVDAAIELPQVERDANITQACAGDAKLLADVQSMLAALEAVSRDHFLDSQDRTMTIEPIREKVGSRIGPYKLLEQIGEGGFGVVFVAEQEKPVARRVALKIIKLGMDTRAVIARFEAERQALAMMDHPNIARVFDAGATDTGRPYFVMELVKGKPITDYCDDEHLSLEQRLKLFLQVCHAIQHAHQKGIIHRDIKPSNVLVRTQDGEPHAKVIDFGIAKATAARLTEKTVYTEHHQLIGTPEYMSPEQAEGSLDIDTRTDVYSLGVMMYELLAGATPFDGAMLRSAAYGEMQRIIKEVEPPKPSTRVATLAQLTPSPCNQGQARGEGSSIPRESTPTLASVAACRNVEPKKLNLLLRGELDWIVMKSLDKNRARRYETANDLAADVTRHLTAAPVVAAPPSVAYRIKKFVVKRKAAVITTSGVAAALLLGIIGTTLMSVRAEHEKKRAIAEKTRADERTDDAEWQSYIANLAAAQSAMANESWKESRQRLDISPESKRGWEWKFLRRQAENFLVTLPEKATNGVFSPNGTQLLTWSDEDEFVRLWDATGKSVGEPMELPGRVTKIIGGFRIVTSLKHSGVVKFAAFSPDGTRIVTASGDGSVRLWSAMGKPIGEAMEHHSNVACAVFSPDGMRIVTASDDGTARLWSAIGNSASKSIGEPMTHDGAVRSAVFSPDGTRILTVSSHDRTSVARLWDSAGKPLGNAMKHDDVIHSAVFSPDGTRIVTASEDGTARLWSAISDSAGNPIDAPMNNFNFGEVFSADFSSDGARIVTVSGDTKARLWDATGKPIGEPVNIFLGLFAIFSPEGARIVTACDDDTARLWSAVGDFAGQPIGEPMKHDGYVKFAVFSPDGTRIVTTSADGTARLWDIDGKPLAIARGHDGKAVVSATFSPNGRSLLVGIGSIRAEDGGFTQSGCALANLDDIDAPWDLFSKDENPDLRIALAMGDSRAMLADSRRAITLDSQIEAEGEEDGTIRIHYAVRENGPRGNDRVLPAHDVAVRAIAFNPEGTRMVSGSNDRTVRVWDTKNWQQLVVLNQPASVERLMFTPDGTRLVVDMSDGSIQILDARPASEREKDRDAQWNERKPAKKYAADLLAGPTKTDELTKVLKADPSLTPLRRVVAMEILLDRKQELERDAQKRREDLAKIHITPARVLAAAQADGSLSPRERESLLNAIASWKPDGDQTYRFAWRIVAAPHSSATAYASALEEASAWVTQYPNNRAYLELLGLAEFRANHFVASKKALQSAIDAMQFEDPRHPFPEYNTLIPFEMCRFQLGQRDEARRALANLKAEAATEKIEPDEQAFFVEAEALMNPSSTQPATQPSTQPGTHQNWGR